MAHEYIIDMWLKVESNRLNCIKNHGAIHCHCIEFNSCGPFRYRQIKISQAVAREISHSSAGAEGDVLVEVLVPNNCGKFTRVFVEHARLCSSTCMKNDV